MRNKNVWITGGSSGIGRALALTICDQANSILLTARNAETLSLVKEECGKVGSCPVELLPLDLENEREMAHAASSAIDALGTIDVVIHAAGFSQRSSVIDTPYNNLQRLMQVHYFSPARISQDLLPHFLERGSGHIVAISSLSGKFGVPYRSGYSAAKHAVHGFFDSLRAEYEGDGIRVLIACPGYVKTSISLNALASDGGKHGKMDKNQVRGMSAEECASQIISAISKNKTEVYIGGKEIYAIYLKRFFPRLLNRFVRKAVSQQ